MQLWIIDFVVSPPFERPHLWSYIMRLEISKAPTSTGARLWSRKYKGMDWMQDPPVSDLRVGEPSIVQWERAKSLLSVLRGANVQIAPCGSFGIHPTSYRLKVSSGANACEMAWCDDLPPEFISLAEAVKDLEALANEYAREA